MSALFAAWLIMAQAPVAVQPPPSEQPVKVKKHKPKQICQTVDVTGSRVPQRVCHDADAPPPMEQDMKDATFGVARIDSIQDPAIVLPK